MCVGSVRISVTLVLKSVLSTCLIRGQPSHVVAIRIRAISQTRLGRFLGATTISDPNWRGHAEYTP